MSRTIRLAAFIGLSFLLSGCITKNDEVLVTPYTKVDFTSGTETKSFDISSNFLWTIEMADTWINVTPLKGYGDKSISVTVSANTSLESRQTSFFIVGEQTRREITVTQAGEAPTLSLDATQKSVRASGDTVSVGVTTNLELTITSEVSWISYIETHTITGKRYVLNVSPNTTLQERIGRVEFKQKNGTLSALLTIVQSGEAPAVQVDKETVSAPYGGGEYSVNVTSNISWQATSSASWLHFTGTRLMETSACLFVLDTNTRVEPREAKITIRATDYPSLQPAVVTVSQEGAAASATITPQVLNDVPAAGGPYTLNVEANFDWEVDATATADWVTQITPVTGKLNFSITANQDVDPRSTTFKIKQKNGTYLKTVTVNQLAGESKVILPDQENMPRATASGGLLNVPVTSNIEWKATVSQTWLSVVETKGLHTSTVVLSVQPNQAIAERIALLIITTQETPAKVYTRIIRQSGASAFITITPDTLDVQAAGGTCSMDVESNIEWTINSQPSWVGSMTITPVSDIKKTVTFSVLANTQTAARSSKIELIRVSGSLKSSMVINQKGETPYVNAEISTSQPLSNEGDTFSLTVNSNVNTDYYIVGSPSWITLAGKVTEDRTSTYSFVVSPVPSLSSRAATLYVRDVTTQQVYKSFTVTQKGARIAQKDSLALVRFYHNTDGGNWRDAYLWNLQLPVTSWPGVTLEAETAIRNGARHVKKLLLSDARLSGAIGDGLSQNDPLSDLTYVESIDLSGNSGLSGWLPKSWKNLNNLETLDLENCSITNYLVFGYNIPKEYGAGLKNLTTFIIKNNLLNDTIPAEVVEHPHFGDWKFAENMMQQKGSNELYLP